MHILSTINLSSFSCKYPKIFYCPKTINISSQTHIFSDIYKKNYNMTYNVANIRLSRILHNTLSKPLLKSVCILKTSSKAVFRIFLATLKQIMQSYSSCITDCQHDFEKEKYLENILCLRL